MPQGHKSSQTSKRQTTEARIDAAIEHILYCVEHQSPGFIPIQTLKPKSDGTHRPQDIYWFRNDDPKLPQKLRAVLKKISGQKLLVLYTPCAFSKKQAKAEFAVPGSLLYVDADEGSNV
jgi:hypothetical protein